MRRKSKALPVQRPKFSVGDRVRHRKSDCMSGEIVRLTDEKAYVRWDETNGQSTAYRPDNLKCELPLTPLPEKDCDFSVGDYVSGWSPKPGTGRAFGTVERIGNKYLVLDGDRAVLASDAKRELKPEGVAGHHAAEDEPANQATPAQDSIKEGDRVTFTQYWHGEPHPFEGTVRALDSVTAIVDYVIPEHLQDGAEHCCQIQSRTATFALAKVADALPPEYSESDQLLAQIAAIQAEGAIAPDHCWIERWERSPDFIECRYRARTAIFLGKRGGKTSRQYLGKEGDPEHSAAADAIDRRNRIAKLQKQLEKIDVND